MFKTNHQNTGNNDLIKEGEYEVLILDVVHGFTQGGTENVRIHMVVRNDVDQEYKNKHIWDTMWMSEKAMPYTERKINSIDKILQMPEAEYETYEDWGRAVARKPIRAKVTHSKPTPGYEPREQVSYFMATRAPAVAHKFPDPKAVGESPAAAMERQTAAQMQQSGFIETDEELPF